LGCCCGNKITLLLLGPRQRLTLYRLSANITAG
jgi:hypothetical protein